MKTMLQKWTAAQSQKVIPANQTWYAVVTMSGPRGTIESAEQTFGNIDFFNRITQENQYASHLLFFTDRDGAANGRGPVSPSRWAVIEISNLNFSLEKESPNVSFFTFPQGKHLTVDMIKGIHLVYPDPKIELKSQFVWINNPGYSKQGNAPTTGANTPTAKNSGR